MLKENLDHKRKIHTPSWLKEAAYVNGLADGLGMPIDTDIKDTVIALRLLKFETQASCAGHSARRTTGPYVIFSSPSARDLYMEAEKLPPGDNREDTLKKCIELCLRDANRLRRIVERFDMSHPSSRQMEVRPLGYSSYRLCFVHADFSSIMTPSQHARDVGRRRKTLKEFTGFLIHALEHANQM